MHSTQAALRRRPVVHHGGRTADGPYATVTAACRNAPHIRRGCRRYRARPRFTVTRGLLRTSRRRARDNHVDSTVGYVGSTAAWQHFAGLWAMTTRGCARARGFVHVDGHFGIIYESYVLTGRCSGLLWGHSRRARARENGLAEVQAEPRQATCMHAMMHGTELHARN